MFFYTNFFLMLTIKLIKGDITKIKVDVIVNAANNGLLGGGGVDGAIHKAGGPAIMAACDIIRKERGGCPTGEAVITTAGKLPAQFVIHTVGPIWKDGNANEQVLLKNAYESSLKLADQYEMTSIAFPNISTGVYGFPKNKAAKIAVSVVKSFKPTHLKEVIFVCFDDVNKMEYEKLLGK